MSRINCIVSLSLLGTLVSCARDQSTGVPEAATQTPPTTSGPPIQHFVSLTVAGSGAGRGNVWDTQRSLACSINVGLTSGTCTATWALPGPLDTLTAEALGLSAFTGWSGACSGTGLCVVQMSSSQSVTAVSSRTRYILSVREAGPGGRGVTATFNNPSR